MPKDSGPISLVYGAAPKRGGHAENDAGWSVPGIVSCTLAVLLAVAGAAVVKLRDPGSVGSRPSVLFWTVVVFGLGAGAGMGLAGLFRSRSSKLSPAIGLLLNVGLFAMLIWLTAVGNSRPGLQSRLPARSAPAPR